MADRYFSNFTDYAKANGFYTSITPKKGFENTSFFDKIAADFATREYKAGLSAWNKDRELQNKEFEVLKQNDVKTTNYSNAVSNSELDSDRARAQAALDEEQRLLGKRLLSMGSTSLLGGL